MQDNSKQLFICDDVFGDISLHASQRDDWTRGFLRLLGSLGRDHKLIWTAREYILREALSSSRLKEERPALATTDTVTVAVDHLTRLEKAMILYNHARVANLPAGVRDFLRGKACITIIDHPNYSPESIRQLCTGRLLSFSESSHGDQAALTSQVHDFLATPGEAWKAAYLAATAGERLLCTEVMAAGGAIPVSQLRRRYENSILVSPDAYRSFDTSFATAEGTFLRKKPHFSNDDLVQFYHPSMRDLLGELIQTDKGIRIAYLKQLALKEMSALARPSRPTSLGGSADHRLLVTDNDEIDLLKDHLNESLLPIATLSDALSVISDLQATLMQNKNESHYKVVRESPNYGKVLWMIMDSVVPYVCSKPFWQKNSDAASVLHWRMLFELLRGLLPYTAAAPTPSYVPELLRKCKYNSSIGYWGLVSAAHSIVPTVVEQCIDLRERESCRLQLVDLVEHALYASERVDLGRDYEASQRWHDEYETVPENCEDYAAIFPDDDQIPRTDELSDVFRSYPRLEDEPDTEHDISSARSSSSASDQDVLEVFSDL